MWIDRAACGGILTFLDWPIDRQLALCARCPVSRACAQAAKVQEGPLPEEKAGVWGGLPPEARVTARFRSELCPRGHRFAETVVLQGGRWECGECIHAKYTARRARRKANA